MKAKKSEVGVFTVLPVEHHEKLVEISDSCKMTLKELTKRILSWAGDVGEKRIRELGVPLPIWPECPSLSTQDGWGSSN